MHCVLWSYPAPAGLSKERADELFAQTAQIYVGVPGLVRKYFGYSEDGFIVRCSWGGSWGRDGYVAATEEYLTGAVAESAPPIIACMGRTRSSRRCLTGAHSIT